MSGTLHVVGLGPGPAHWTTPEATAALQQATDVLGYGPYIARVPRRAGQTHRSSGNGNELQRAREALLLAQRGGRVVVVSGGDAGVFAMAAAVFEAIDLGPPSWRELDVHVVPGVTAMLAAAARVGAPLGNDFCAINLSDNLKPWSVVDHRLRKACEADFSIALYNPASRARPRQIHRAFETLRAHRSADAVVLFARAIGRKSESLHCTTLGDAEPGRADMQTLLIIGCSTTRLLTRPHAPPWVYAPRQLKGEPCPAG